MNYSDAYKVYDSLAKLLREIRSSSVYLQDWAEKVEDNILDIMEDLWYKMSKEEQKEQDEKVKDKR